MGRSLLDLRELFTIYQLRERSWKCKS